MNSQENMLKHKHTNVFLNGFDYNSKKLILLSLLFVVFFVPQAHLQIHSLHEYSLLCFKFF